MPLRYQTIGEALQVAATTWPQREALVVVHEGIRWNYTQLEEQAQQAGAGLLSLGLMPGDRVGIWAPNCAEWTVAQFATAKAGLILVNINPGYRPAELQFALHKVGCRALITAERFKGSDYCAMLRELLDLPGEIQQPVHSQTLPELRWIIQLGGAGSAAFMSWSTLLDRASADHRQRLAAISGTLQPDEAINIQFTSGTTGSPKGATLSHFNILNNGLFVGQRMNLSERDRICIPVPLYHCFGMVLGNLAAVTHGAAMIYPGESFEPRATLRAIEAERATVLYGVPAMFIGELELPDFDQFDLTSLRTGIMAGAPCPVQVMQRVIREMHMTEVTIAYGMTETSPVSFQSFTDDPLDRRVSTVGRVHPHVQVKVIDPEGDCVARGVQGELCTRGYSVMKGYWNDLEKTREVIDEDAWLHTGDLGVIDADGYARITGRLKDMLIRGGENIFPREIEDFLYSHPQVQAVQVFGVPDARYGEEICAWVQLKPGAELAQEDLRAFCRGHIAHFKIPRYVRFVSGFPMTVTGKVQKFAMREQMIQELGLPDGAGPAL